MHNIGSQTRILGLMGHNIGYSLSPLIHNFAAKQLGINSIYLPFDLASASAEEFLKVMWDIGAVGFNVTKPLKAHVAQLTNAKQQSINTLWRGDRGWKSTSTDIPGLEKAITLMGADLYSFSRIVILGNGGVSLALVEALNEKRTDQLEIFVLRRTLIRDSVFYKACLDGPKLDILDFDAQVFAGLVQGHAGETLVVQSSSAPLAGNPLHEFAAKLDGFYGFVVELTYGHESALLRKAEDTGLPCQDGIPMLVEQARLSQRYWWGDSVSSQDIMQCLADAGIKGISNHATSKSHS